MENSREVINLRRKSRKPTKNYALAHFVVIKKKDKKTKKLALKIKRVKSPKRGKIRKKRKTTLKKRILIARSAKKEVEEITGAIEKLNVVEEPVVTTIRHSNNFREYCDHFITTEIRELSTKIIKDLLRFQENKFQQNPIKAKAHRRYVVGFKEVKKFLLVDKLKLIFIATDLERNKVVDDLVNEIKLLALEHKSFCIFSEKRRKLGFLLLKKVPVSILGIFDYQGTTENVNLLMSLVKQKRLEYNKAFL